MRLLAGLTRVGVAGCLLAVAASYPVAAQPSDLRARLSPEVIQQVFPGAEEVGPPSTSGLPALPVRIGGVLRGYIFTTLDTVNATGYSGIPFDLVGGLALDGAITGAALVNDHESIIGRGVSRAVIDDFLSGFASTSLQNWRAVRPDAVSGATTSARLMKRGMQAAARLVASGYLPDAVVSRRTLDRDSYVPTSTAELLADGSVSHLLLASGEVLRAFHRIWGAGAAPQHAFGDPVEPFLDVYVALLTPPSIGINALGALRFAEVLDRQPPGGLTLWILCDGRYRFANTSLQLMPTDFFFDYVRIVQGDLTIPLTRSMYRPVRAYGTGLLDANDSAAFFLEEAAGLDPLLPWAVQIAVQGKTAGGDSVTVAFTVPYEVPVRHILLPPAEPPVWLDAWSQRAGDLAILAALLAVVTCVFLFQDVLVQRRRVYAWTRTGLMACTLGWLGWVAGGQLSVVNLMAWVQAPFTGTGISAFLLDPLLFVLSVYVAISLLVLGRGVFCGWLCPFGALQELLNQAARALRVPQLQLPAAVEARLRLVKYLAALTVLGLVFVSVDLVDRVTEVEPFTTAISARFGREWPFVLYAGAVLVAGLFHERFFCRFLCPLGGALAILGHFHLLNLLRRRPECGTPCRLCERGCPVGAIRPTGAIDMDECLQCLDCQVEYADDKRCPPLVEARKSGMRSASEFGATQTAGHGQA